MSMLFETDMDKGAEFSPCRVWRYALWRTWDGGPRLVVIGYNPSTADETTDDRTIGRCIDYARRWGCGGLVMLNLFAYRSTDPDALYDVADPIGPGNDAALVEHTREAPKILAAWGAFPLAEERGPAVLRLINRPVLCLGVTKQGMPRHPLYQPAELLPVAHWLPSQTLPTYGGSRL
jgi:hypothetical protein